MPNSGFNGTWRAMKDRPKFWEPFKLPVIGWKFFYVDGSTFSSEDGKCCDAPSEDVICYMVYGGGGRTGIWNHDEYNPKDCTCVKLGGMVGELGCVEYEVARKVIMDDKWRPEE